MDDFMPDIKDINNLHLIATFLVPGLIITYIRAQFITGRIDKITDAVLAYFTITIIYYAIMMPLIQFILDQEPGAWKNLLWLVLILVGPAAFGISLGIAVQHQWLRWIAIKLRLRLVHGTPTSWDWQFGNCQVARFVMVTLTDGSSIAGIFGKESFASTDPTERDVYIQELMDVSEDGAWSYRAEVGGILLMAKEIRYIEFRQEL